jgi:hypothetical protein
MLWGQSIIVMYRLPIEKMDHSWFVFFDMKKGEERNANVCM